MKPRVAIVTGASRNEGLGAQIARELADDGWSLLLTGWSNYDVEQGLVATEDRPAELSLPGTSVARFDADLSDPDSIQQVFSAARELGRVTGLVNNAAYSTASSIDDIDSEVLDRHYAVNLRAPALLCTRFAREFRSEADAIEGRIINITSGQGLTPMPEELAYAATKGGLEALTTSLAPRLARNGITINAIDPGPTDTGWMTEEQREALVSPFGRLATPRDAARLVRFLMSPQAQWITGQIIRSRGGL